MTSQELFLGIDVGTSALKAVAIDAAGAVHGSASASYETISPQPGWTEQAPDDWWDACTRALGELGVAIQLKDIVAIGVTGQMHGSVFLDAEREVIRPAMLWNDQRTHAEAAAIEAAVGRERLLAITGNRSFTGFTAPKLLWLRQNATIAYKRLHHLLLPKDYIRLKLTGELATDTGDASGTGLFDVGARAWSVEIIDALDLDASVLPQVYEGPELTGIVLADVARELGLRAGTPVVAGGGDQQAGAVGAGAVTSGVAMISIGTSAEVFAPIDTYRPEPEGRLHTMCHSNPGAWHTMGVTLSGGAAMRWLANAVASITGGDPLAALFARAAGSPPGARGVVFAPYLAGERMPHNDPYATATFAGLRIEHDIGDMARAVMEGVAFNLREIADLTRANGGIIDEVRLIGGGAQSDLCTQILADVLSLPIARVASIEGSAIGAAILAAVGAGAHASVREATDACVRVASIVEPRNDPAAMYDEHYARFKALYRAHPPS